MNVLRLGDRTVDLSTGAISDGGRLRPMELAVVAYLYERQGELVSHEELLRQVWGYAAGVKTRTLFSTIYRIRKALESSPKTPRFLVSGHAGYRLISTSEPTTPPEEARVVLFGREEAVARVRRLLAAGERAVVLSGPPGVGKTRLAQCAFPEALFADLTAVQDEAGLYARLLQVLDVDLAGEQAAHRVVQALKAVDGVVVLDNAEHLVEPVCTLLRACLEEGVTEILVTSRLALPLSSVESFALPPLETEAATQLLLERAATPIPTPLARTLAQALDGLPLALELAARRCRTLPAEHLLVRLDEQRRLLTTRDLDVSARHHSLESALQVSWDLLPAHGRLAMMQLAVFVAPARLVDVEAVLDLPDTWSVDALELLVDHSLLLLQGQRYRMLASVQRFVQAATPDDVRASAEARHGACLAGLGTDELANAMRDDAEKRRVLIDAREDLRVAWDRAVQRGDSTVAAHTLRALGQLEVYEPTARSLLPLLDRTLALDDGPLRAQLHVARARARLAADHALDDVLTDSDRSIELATPAEAGNMWLARCNLLVRLGRMAEALEAVARADAESARSGPADQQARIALRRGVLEEEHFEVRLPSLHDAIRTLRSRERHLWAADGALFVARRLWMRGKLSAARATFEEARDGYARSGIENGLVDVQYGQCLVDLDADPDAEIAADLRDVSTRYLQRGLPVRSGFVHYTLASLHAAVGDVDASMEHAERGQELIGDAARDEGEAYATVVRTEAWLHQRPDRAVAPLQRASELAVSPTASRVVRTMLARALRLAGRPEEALGVIEDVGPARTLLWFRFHPSSEAGWCHLAAGRADEALACARLAISDLRERGGWASGERLLLAARSLHGLGRAVEAQSYAERARVAWSLPGALTEEIRRASE